MMDGILNVTLELDFAAIEGGYWIWRLRTGGVECVIGVAVAGAGLDGERSL